MTRYHVLISDDLTEHLRKLELRNELDLPTGFRLVEPSGPGHDGRARWWLCEDDNAPAELEQQRVEPVFVRGRMFETDELYDHPVITERHVVDERGRRI